MRERERERERKRNRNIKKEKENEKKRREREREKSLAGKPCRLADLPRCSLPGCSLPRCSLPRDIPRRHTLALLAPDGSLVWSLWLGAGAIQRAWWRFVATVMSVLVVVAAGACMHGLEAAWAGHEVTRWLGQYAHHRLDQCGEGMAPKSKSQAPHRRHTCYAPGSYFPWFPEPGERYWVHERYWRLERYWTQKPDWSTVLTVEVERIQPFPPPAPPLKTRTKLAWKWSSNDRKFVAYLIWPS
jgi:hypothetical protein